MSRAWTARKKTTFEAAAVAGDYSLAPKLHRAGPGPEAGRKQALRLLAGYTFLALPLHAGLCWVAGTSLPLATGIALGLAAAASVVALAKWLGLDDVLQRLPILIAVGLLVMAIGYVYQHATQRAMANFEMVGGMLTFLVIATLVGGFFRPMAVAYRNVTTKVPVRDLCAAGAALLVSLALVWLAYSLPRWVTFVVAGAVTGGFAGLVVLEYAAWARSNPAVPLDRVATFDVRLPRFEGEPPEEFSDTFAVQSAALSGLAWGGALWLSLNWSVPQAGGTGLPIGQDPYMNGLLPFSILLILLMPTQTNWAMNGSLFENPFTALSVAADALVVFLTYPEEVHPLSHRVRTPWLRPVGLRLALAGVALAAVATVIIKPSAKAPAPSPAQATAAFDTHASLFSKPTSMSHTGQRADRLLDPSPDPWDPHIQPAPPPLVPTADVGPAKQAGERFWDVVTTLVILPPLVIYAAVCFVGLTVLPTYYRWFEKPQPAPKAR